jgi:HK97 family phage prohead protease/HK97 family phage major capsid protein
MENAAPQNEELRNAYGENVETRTMELRATDDGDLMILEGFAANFEQETDLGYFKEKIARGAFEGRLKDDVRYLLNHKGVPMARTNNGTLELEVREEGLYTRAVLNDTQQSKDVYKAVKRGDITSMSFAFTIDEDEIDVEQNLRTVTKVKKLYDVSAVTYPAYPQTSIKARDAFSAKLEMAVVEEPTEPTPEVREEVTPQKSTPRKIERKHPHSKMNINDLKGQRAAHYEEFVALGDNADQEGRSMTEAEQERADRLNELIEDIDVKIRHKKREQDMVQRQAHVGTSSTSEQKEIDKTNYRFSLSRALDAARQNRNLEGAEAEWQQEAHREMRHMGLSPAGAVAIPAFAMRAAEDNFTAAGAAAGGTAVDGTGFVGTDVPGAIEALRQPSFIQSLGAQTIQATGNLKFPRISSPAEATNKAEVTAAAGASLEMDEVTLSPLRATAETKYSKQLLIQGGAEVDSIIANDLRAALATHIDIKGFAEILADAAVDSQTTSGDGDTTYAAAVAIAQEAAVLAAGGDLNGSVYVASPTAYKLAKTLSLVPNVSALHENGRLNGYQLFATKHIADETAGSVGQQIFGNFRQGLIIALFGGLDILVDPFTAASTGQVKLHCNRFYDVALRQPGAFSVVNDLSA